VVRGVGERVREVEGVGMRWDLIRLGMDARRRARSSIEMFCNDCGMACDGLGAVCDCCVVEEVD